MKTETQWTFHKSNMSQEEYYNWMNKNWDKKLMEAIPENLRSKLHKMDDSENAEITVWFTWLQKEENA